MKAGDRVTLTFEGRTVTATVALASPNGRSLILVFEAIIDGHVGTMPILLHDDGIYRTLMTNSPITLTGMQ